MGSTNHGTQTVSHKYYEEVTANNRNVRLNNIVPRGIYDGGYLERVDDTEITLSAICVEIGDDDVQVRIATSDYAYISDDTVDSGALSQATPYVVLRWAYAATQANYMEIHMLASVSAAQANDIIVGKVVFSGSVITAFDYSDRTILPVANQWLKPIQDGDGSMYVVVRSGRVHIGSGSTNVQEYSVGPFVTPSAPYSRIDLVYIDDTGVPQILQGTPAVTPAVPSYGGRLVVAEVTVVNGDTSISQSRINDVRTFVSRNVIVDDQTVHFNSTTGELEIKMANVVPHWTVEVMDASNLSSPTQFTSPIATWCVPSFGSADFGQDSRWWMKNNSVLFTMQVTSISTNVKYLKLFAVNNNLYVYIDGALVWSSGVYETMNTPLTCTINLTDGDHTVDMVYNDIGGSNRCLQIVGDIVDGTSVKFKA